jgi:hypothetical protein
MNLTVSSLDFASAERADDKATSNIPVNPASAFAVRGEL